MTAMEQKYLLLDVWHGVGQLWGKYISNFEPDDDLIKLKRRVLEKLVRVIDYLDTVDESVGRGE